MTRVKVSKSGVLGEIILNNPDTLNALSQADIQTIKSALAAHEADPGIRAIVIRSTSQKAFCAGGDMKHIRELAMAGQLDAINAYFKEEYSLNLAISNCSKPYIAMLDGFAMGGGLGVSIHGSVRIITERSVLAMPETRIGFFPDVGASFFLPRLPHRAGYWLGLTALAVKAHEAVQVGLGTHLLNSEDLSAMCEAVNDSLAQLDNPDESTLHACVTQCVDRYAKPYDNPDFQNTMLQRALWFSSNDLPTIDNNLEQAASSGSEDAATLLKLLRSGSPHAAATTLQLMLDADGKTLADCLQLELALAARTATHPDCIEGIRAVLVDKDRKPVWQSAHCN